MTTVVGSNIYSETWSILYSTLSGNVTDPTLANRTGNLQFIFGAFPDFESSKRPSFPVIVIDNPQSYRNKTTLGYGEISNDISTSVWAYSKSNQQVNSLTDDIQNKLLQSRKNLLFSGLTLVSVNTGAQGTDILNNQRIHYTETQLKFKLYSTSG